MAQAEPGQTVRVHYTGSLEDGTVFDSSSGREPLEFTVGAGNVIPGFERAVVAMLSKPHSVFTLRGFGAVSLSFGAV